MKKLMILFLPFLLMMGCQNLPSNAVSSNLTSVTSTLTTVKANLKQKNDTDDAQQVSNVINQLNAAQKAESLEQSQLKTAQDNYNKVINSFRYKAGGFIEAIIWTIVGIGVVYLLGFLLSLFFPGNQIISLIWKYLLFWRL